MAKSSSNSSVIVEVAEEYPYPSHVFAPNFVTVKLSGRDKYSVWRTQMLCLLESHDMLGFINGPFASPNVEAWRRSDALVKGWILGSLSEQAVKDVVANLRPDFTAKNLWDELQSIYASEEEEHNEITREAESRTEADPISQETEKQSVEDAKQHADERANSRQMLYGATLRGRWEDVEYVLGREKVTVTDKITINGNTALHVAVGTGKKGEFIEKMLKLVPERTLLDMRNSDGSTVLHVAAIVGNTDAARILMERNRDLLFVEDHDGCTPLSRALSNMHTDTYVYLLGCTEQGTMFAGRSGEELLVNVIASKDFASALELMKERYDVLESDVVLMAIAQNFPREASSWERIARSLLQASDTVDMGLNICEKCCMRMFCLRCCEQFILILGALWLARCLRWLTVVLPRMILRVLGWPLYKLQKKRDQTRQDATRLLRRVCKLIYISNDSSSLHHYYTNPVLEATRQNAYTVVEEIVSYFPNAIWSVNEDGHNIIQSAVVNRSEKVYNLLYQMSEHKNIYKTIKDSSGNNLLHLAGRLAPSNKLNLISGAALQIQRELQWFKEVEGFVCPLNIIQKNAFDETPQIVFTREHKDLVIEGEKWMKSTAESYTITAALITTIVFAAAITVPGGNHQDTGIPIFTNDTAFTIFAVADAISLFTSTTSLLMFLSILTARFAEQDFLLKLPTKLIIGLATLFISTTAMLVAFGATLFLVFGQRKPWILIPIAALTCLPITSFVTLQFPLIADLMSATYGCSIFGKQGDDPFY